MNKFIYIFCSLILILAMNNTNAQSVKVRNVAIFVYEGAEILDFAGPGEVFAATAVNGERPFNVYTVAVNPKPILSQGFITITPEYTIDNCPTPDILVIPGGASGKLTKDEKLLKWVKGISSDLDIGLTVCTGVSVFAAAGMLDGLHATTWWGYVDRFEKQFPSIKVHKDKRFVDNGKMVTTAGVSAGIDGSLHVVSKLLSEDVARATARYMEYDKWEPDAGLIVDDNSK